MRLLSIVACLLLASCSVAALAEAHSYYSAPPPHAYGRAVPVAAPASDECVLPAGFVHLSDVSPSIIQEMRYGTLHNFMGRVVDEYEAPVCILSVEAATALNKVQHFLLSGAADPVSGQAYSLKMYDCYRPTGAVANFVSWALNISDTLTKAEFYPTESKSNLFSDGYIAYRSGHSKGSTMDLTIVALPAAPQPIYQPGVTVLEPCFAPRGVRWQDNSIDMGTGQATQHTRSNNPPASDRCEMR